MIPITRTVRIYQMSCARTTQKKVVDFPSGCHLIQKGRCHLRFSLKSHMDNMATNILINLETNNHIQEGLPGVGAEGWLIYGKRMPRPSLLHHKASELRGPRPLPCALMTLPDHSQMEGPQLSHSLAQAPDLFQVRELGAIKPLQLQTRELWAPVTGYELVYRVGAVGEAVLRLK